MAALSLVSDLGMGQPMEHNLRQCLIASRLGARIGLDEAEREGVYYAGIMSWVGCHVDAYEQAKWFGDDMALKGDSRNVDFATEVAGMKFVLGHLGAGRPLLHRARLGVGFIGGGMKDAEAMLDNHWRAIDSLAGQLGFNDNIRMSIRQTFERWDGKGVPDGARGDELLVTSRLVALADVVEVFHRVGGVEAARAVARERSGTQFDPALVELFCDVAEELFAELEETSSWAAVLDSEPGLAKPLPENEVETALEAIADFTDVKSPYTIGHSRGVADLASDAASVSGLPAVDVTAVRRAGLLHDLGRLGVSNSVWDKPGALSLAEMERVRMHPYLTERTLASSPGLAPLGTLAMQHHERLDGSGYPRGLGGEAISAPARLLAAADCYRARTEPRPHRPAANSSEAAYTTSFTIGSALSFWVIGQFDAMLQWRAAVALTAAGPLLGCLLVGFGLRAVAVTPHPGAHAAGHVRAVLASVDSMRYVVGYAAHVWELFALRAWIVPFVVFCEGWRGSASPVAVASIAAIVSLIGVPASLSGAEMTSRWHRPRVIVTVMMLSVAASLAVVPGARLSWMAMICAVCVYSAFISADSAALTSGLVSVAPPPSRGTAMAIYSTLGFAAASAGTFAVGFTLDLLGGQSPRNWMIAFALMSAPNVIGAVAVRRASR
jgi:HD-GYP domain-containing protein (c-di-GMP phosphodiesterase class II)